MVDLSKIGIRVTALGNQIVLARFGKDPNVSLDQRDAHTEFWSALLSYAFEHEKPEVGDGREINFSGENDAFTVTIRRTA